MTKDKVLFYLRRARNEKKTMSQEELAKQGISYERRHGVAEQMEMMKAEFEAISIALELVQNARSDNLVFRD